ncbi:MAG: MFS transporter [Desulfobacterales bacterium]|jgi:sugar phosphate permease
MPSFRFTHYAWVILFTCFANLFINYAVQLGYGVILPEMIQALNFSRTAAGTIFNAYLIIYIALTPLTGYLADRLGARRIITAGALILGIGTVLMGTVQTLWMACAVYSLVGIGATGMWIPIIALVQRWFAADRRGLALGILSVGYGLGFATVGAAFPWIVNHYSWRYAWFLLGFAALGMAVVNGLLLRKDPAAAGTEPWGFKKPAENAKGPLAPPQKSEGPSSILRNRMFWLIGVSYFAVCYCLYAITTYMVDFGGQIGMTIAKASFLATVHGLGQVAGVLIVLPLSDFLGRIRTIIISNAMITCSLLGIIIIGNSWQALYALIGCFALFYGATFPLYGACAGDYFPQKIIATVAGAWTPFYGLGAITAHWVTGWIRDTTGTYHLAFAIAAVMALLAILMIRFARQTGR